MNLNDKALDEIHDRAEAAGDQEKVALVEWVQYLARAREQARDCLAHVARMVRDSGVLAAAIDVKIVPTPQHLNDAIAEILDGKLAEGTIKEMHCEGGTLRLEHGMHWAIGAMAMSFERSLGSAENYIEMVVTANRRKLLVTLRQEKRPSAHDLRVEAESGRALAEEALAKMEQELKRVEAEGAAETMGVVRQLEEAKAEIARLKGGGAA